MHSDLRPESSQWLFKSPLAGGGSILWWAHYKPDSLLELRMMEVVLTADIRHTKLQSIHHHQKPTPGFLLAGCPSCFPTNSIKALKEKKYHITQTWLTQAPLGSSNVVFHHYTPVTLGECLLPSLSSAL